MVLILVSIFYLPQQNLLKIYQICLVDFVSSFFSFTWNITYFTPILMIIYIYFQNTVKTSPQFNLSLKSLLKINHIYLNIVVSNFSCFSFKNRIFHPKNNFFEKSTLWIFSYNTNTRPYFNLHPWNLLNINPIYHLNFVSSF